MYQDPTKIRSHVVKLRFSDAEHALIKALTDYTGAQKASLLREMVVREATEVLGINEGIGKGITSAH